MNLNHNLTKTQRKKLKQTEKRKASSSPDIDTQDINSSYSGQCVSSVTSDISHNGVFTNSADYVQSVMNGGSQPPVFNMGQYPNMGYPGTPVMQQSAAPPPWALGLIEDVKTIKAELKTVSPKISEIEKILKTIQYQMTQIDQKVKSLETKSTETENGLSFMSNQFEKQKGEIAKLQEKIPKMETAYKKIETKDTERKINQEKTQDKLCELEARSMKSNLIFYGLNEPQSLKPGETGVTPPDDMDTKVRDLIKNTVGIDTTDIEFLNIHRLGFGKRPRPIIIKFKDDRDREKIRLKSYDEAIRKLLKEKGQGVGVQSPQAYREARKAFYNYTTKEGIDVKTTRISGTKLYVNNTISKKFINGKVLNHDDYTY